MRRFVRVLKVFGKGLLVLVAVTVVALLVMRWVFVRQFDREIAAIKARGEPLTEAEMAGLPVPDSENAALVYQKAFEELPPDKVFWDQTDRIRKLLQDGNPRSLGKAREMMKSYARAMALSEQATLMPKCAFSPDRPIRSADSPRFRLGHLAQIALLYATLDARSGRTDDAVDHIATSMAIDSVHAGKGDLVSALIQESMVVWTCSETRKIAEYGRINERQALRLNTQLAEMNMVAIHKHGLLEERADILNLDHSDPATWDRKRGIPVSTWEAFRSRVDPMGLAWRHVVVIGDQAAWLHFHGKLIRTDYSSYAEAKALQHDAERGIPFYAILTRMRAPVNTRSLDSLFRGDTEINGSRAFVALLAYHDRCHAYPSSLAELRKELGWAIPEDPFSGQDFVYKRQGSGFMLYSVGPDMKDDGGKPRPKGKAYRADAPYDIVWQLDH